MKSSACACWKLGSSEHGPTVRNIIEHGTHSTRASVNRLKLMAAIAGSPEGADEDLDFTRRLDESVGHFGRPVPAEHPLRCAIEYNADQLIKVHLYDGLSGRLLTELEVAHKGMLSEEEFLSQIFRNVDTRGSALEAKYPPRAPPPSPDGTSGPASGGPA